jgi:hypothetical protein
MRFSILLSAVLAALAVSALPIGNQADALIVRDIAARAFETNGRRDSAVIATNNRRDSAVIATHNRRAPAPQITKGRRDDDVEVLPRSNGVANSRRAVETNHRREPQVSLRAIATNARRDGEGNAPRAVETNHRRAPEPSNGVANSRRAVETNHRRAPEPQVTHRAVDADVLPRSNGVANSRRAVETNERRAPAPQATHRR